MKNSPGISFGCLLKRELKLRAMVLNDLSYEIIQYYYLE